MKTDVVVAVAQLVLEKAKRGTYFTLAGGPLLDWNDEVVRTFLFEKIKTLAKEYSADFIRLRPQELESAQMQTILKNIAARPSPMHLTADVTLELDITQTPEELLAQMRKNHRSAIKKAEKLGITVTQTTDPGAIKEFYEQQLMVAQKHGFVPFSYDFLHEQFKAFAADNQVMLFHSYHEGQLLASAFVIFYNKEAVYHYGVSTLANEKLPGSYACQWAAILEAQNRGCTTYNFWGIAPENSKDHRFAGVTLFKTGFGGTTVTYTHSHDIPLSWKYTVINLFELFRKKIRRL